MEYHICSDCDYCITHRTNEQGQVRCARYSRFVDANQKSCEAFYCVTRYNGLHFELFENMKGGAE